MTIRPLPKRSSNQAPPINIPGLETLFSDGSADFVQPLAPYRLGQEVTISIRGLLGVPVNHVDLRIFPDGEERLISMKEQNRVSFTYWSARVALSRCPFPYRFRIQTDRHILWLSASGLHYHMPPDEEDFKLVPGFEAPTWPTYSTFYQIFPDRFFCGNPAQAQAPRGSSPSLAQARLKKWHEPLTRPPQGNDFYGGDLPGIQQKLDYLEELGVNALFLTPIFESPSNHRYDVVDYRRVDPFLGGNEALTALSKALKKRKWKLILDGVFNHAGYHHPWFQEALKGPDSRYRSCFTFRKDDSYTSWLNHSSLPKWDFSSDMVRKELFSGPDAVAKFWLRPPFEIDGWRLDAPNMLGCDGTDTGNIDLWREFRREVKSENPNAFLFGECFFEGTKWLQGDAFDAVMNYKGFTIPMIQWVTGGDLHLRPGEISGRIAVRWLTQMMARIPFEIRNLQFNPLSTHDIPRFIHRVDGNEKLFRLAAVLQMAFPGIPSVYYGEELALDGGADPDNRRPFPWDTIGEHHDLIGFLAKMARLRTSLRVIQSGAFAFLAAEEDTMAYARFLGKDFLIVAANRAGLPRQLRIPTDILGIADGQTLRSLLSMDSLKTVQDNYLQLSLGPREAVWLGPA